MTRSVSGRINGGLDTPTARSKNFKASALRLVKRLSPQRLPTAIVLTLGIVGIAI